MKPPLPIAICLGVVAGFLGCCLLGRLSARKNIYEDFVRLHPFLEQETAYYPTASQLAATARAQCPPGTDKILVILGGNSVFNGSGQKSSEVWSRVLQNELGDGYHVINFSAPGAGVVDNGGVVFQMLARDYPRMLLVANTEPGYYAPSERSPYSYLFWDAYCKGLLPDDRARAERLAQEVKEDGWQEYKLGYGLNAYCYFNDLWTGVAYYHGSTVWNSWLKDRSFRARRRLPDWYDQRRVIPPSEQLFEKLLSGHLTALRRRRMLDPGRFRQEPDGKWAQTEESLQMEAQRIAALIPAPLEQRALIVFTPVNPWFLERLTAEERQRVELSFRNGSELLEKAGFSALSTLDQSFEPLDFGDTVHLSPAGGRRLAKVVAVAIQKLARAQNIAPPQ